MVIYWILPAQEGYRMVGTRCRDGQHYRTEHDALKHAQWEGERYGGAVVWILDSRGNPIVNERVKPGGFGESGLNVWEASHTRPDPPPLPESRLSGWIPKRKSYRPEDDPPERTGWK